MAYDIWTTPGPAVSKLATATLDALDYIGGGTGGDATDAYSAADSGGMAPNAGDLCEVPYMAGRRWYLVAVLGTSLSVVSFVFNVLIARVLLRPKHSHFFFLGLLALSDSFLSFCYGPVIAMDIIKNRLQMLWLTRLWWGYVGPLLAMCHVSMTFSTFMIILGTIERYLITVKSKLLVCFRRNRSKAVIGMLALALILRGTAIFEIKIIKNGNCTGLTEYEPILTPLVDGWFYETVFRFYIRTIATVFIPFFLLGYLNFRIVDTLRRQKRSAAMFRFATSDHKLVANCLNVFITAWEYVDLESTQTEFTYDIYETLTDIISMLYILTCAIRFPLYILFNQEIRSAFYDFLFRPTTGRGGAPGVGVSSSSYASSYVAGNGGATSAYYSSLAYQHHQNGRLMYNNQHYYHSTQNGHRNHSTDEFMKARTSADGSLTPPADSKYGLCARFRAHCISCFCFCCLEDDKYMYDGANSVSDLTGQNQSPSMRRMSFSNCAPIGTDFDRFVVAMALARRFNSRQKESVQQNTHDRGRRCTLPPNMLLNRCEDVERGDNDDNNSTGGVYLGDEETSDASKPQNNNYGDNRTNRARFKVTGHQLSEPVATEQCGESAVKRPTELFNGVLPRRSRHGHDIVADVPLQQDSNANNGDNPNQRLNENSRIIIYENPLARV